ncbi:MAG TPA: hypothetical protein VMM15_11895 [Bradyrhizobium sp.]|nr:hypothetical protein [Bradyrhizobium sp.]
MAERTARSRDAIARAREVLNEAVGSDTFLGRQHYQIVPLPHEEECHPASAPLVDATMRWCDRWSFAGLDHGAIG